VTALLASVEALAITMAVAIVVSVVPVVGLIAVIWWRADLDEQDRRAFSPEFPEARLLRG